MKMKKGMEKKREKQIFVMDGIFRVLSMSCVLYIWTYMYVRTLPIPKI